MKPEVSERLFIEELFKHSTSVLGQKFDLQSIERLTGDASTRRYYRLLGKQKSYVACLDNPSEAEKNSFVTVQHFLTKFGVRVPKIYDMNLKKGYILEEDLGNTTLLSYLSQVTNIEQEFNTYKKIIDHLLLIHRIPMKEVHEVSLFKEAFDLKKLQSEIDFSIEYFIKQFMNIEDESFCQKISSCFERVNERIAKEKMVLTHRDFHSRNVMVSDDEFVIIDFQDARRGIPQYDLVSILDDCYYEIDLEVKNKLIDYYYSHLETSIHGQKDKEVFLSLYNDMVLQRVFKAIGSFSYIYFLRKDVRYVKYIGFAMEKMKRVLLSDSKYDELRTLLFEHYYES